MRPSKLEDGYRLRPLKLIRWAWLKIVANQDQFCIDSAALQPIFFPQTLMARRFIFSHIMASGTTVLHMSAATNVRFSICRTSVQGTLKSATNGFWRAMNWVTRKLTVVTGGNVSAAVVGARAPMAPRSDQAATQGGSGADVGGVSKSVIPG